MCWQLRNACQMAIFKAEPVRASIHADPQGSIAMIVQTRVIQHRKQFSVRKARLRIAPCLAHLARI